MITFFLLLSLNLLFAQESEPKKSAIFFINTNTSDVPNEKGESELGVTDRNKGNKILFTVGSNNEKVSNENVSKKINEITSTNKIETLIISGHNGGGHFSGSKGSLSREQLENIGKNNPEFKNNVRTVILLGCYTTVISQVHEWRDVFPNVEIIAGFDGAAPLSDRPQGHEYLKELLLKEDQLIKVKDLEQIKNVLPSVEQAGFKPAISLCDQNGCTDKKVYFFSSQDKKFFDLDERKKQCLEKYQEIKIASDWIKKLKKGIDPRKKPDEKISKYYSLSRNFDDCYDLLRDDISLDRNIEDFWLDSESYLRLIYSKKVYQNFSKFHQDEIKELKRVLKISEQQNAVTPVKNLPDFETFSSRIKKTPVECLRYLRAKDYKRIKSSFHQLEDLLKGHQLNINDYYDFQQLKFKDNGFETLSEKDQAFQESLIGLKKDTKYAEATLNNICDNDGRIQTRYDQIKKCQEKRFFIPDEKYLKYATRQDILINFHHLTGHMACHRNGFLPEMEYSDEGIKGLYWLELIYRWELEILKVPLSWIESSKNPEVPSDYNSIFEFLSGNKTVPE